MKTPIARRKFLQLGAALPLAVNSLHAEESIRQSEPPRRVIFICNSLGFYKPNFFPAKSGQLDTSRYLKDFKTLSDLTVFEKLFHPGMETSNHDSEKSFLTGAQRPEANGFINSISLDQLLAQSLGGSTRFPFLNFSIYDRGWGCSWNDRGSAIPPMHDESAIFDQLFGPEDLKQKKKKILNDRHILQSLKRDLSHLRETQGDSGQKRQYERLIDRLESKLNHEEFWLKTEKPKVRNSLSHDRQFEFSTKVRNLFELAKLAFRTDSTRVITVSLDWIYGAIKVPGATGGWHTLSHHGGKPGALKSLSCIESSILGHFNQFLVDLKGIAAGKGTLLDYTTVVMGSNFGDASNHTCHELPIIVAGGGWNHQQHRPLKTPTRLCNLWLEILNLHSLDVGKFGTSEKNMGLLS